MKYQEITKLSVKEIEQKLKEEREKLYKMRLTHKISPIEKPMDIHHTRKYIARLKTALNNPIPTPAA